MEDRDFKNAYRNVRRVRYGFHNPRGGLIVQLRDQYTDVYDRLFKAAGNLTKRFKGYIKKIENYNARKLAPFNAYKTKEELPLRLKENYQKDIGGLGNQAAYKRHGWLTSRTVAKDPPPYPNDLKDADISKSTFKNEYDTLATIDRFIRQKLIELGDDWIYADGTLSPKEQYERKVIRFSIGRAGKASDNKKKAIEVARKFFLEILDNEDRLETLYDNKKVPVSDDQARETTRLAKLIVGERVRSPTSSSDNDGEVHHSNGSLVNKLAALLSYLDTEGIGVAKVSDFIDEKGGFEAVIEKARE